MNSLSNKTVREILSFADGDRVYTNEEIESIRSTFNNNLRFNAG